MFLTTASFQTSRATTQPGASNKAEGAVPLVLVVFVTVIVVSDGATSSDMPSQPVATLRHSPARHASTEMDAPFLGRVSYRVEFLNADQIASEAGQFGQAHTGRTRSYVRLDTTKEVILLIRNTFQKLSRG